MTDTIAATRPRPRIDCPACGGHNKHPGSYGWCTSCYRRWRLAGRPEDGPPPPWQHTRAIDDIAVDRAVDPRLPDRDVPPLTGAERRAASATLTASGWAAWRIAQRLGCTSRTIVRYRAAARATAAAQDTDAPD